MSYSNSQHLIQRQNRFLLLFDKRVLPWVICGLGALFYCYEYYLRITPSVMTSDLMSAFHLNAAELGNLSAFYYYAYTPMQLFVGVLMDRYGPQRLLTLACFCCAVGTWLFAYQSSLVVAEFGRFLVGFGSAFAFVGTLKLATMWLPPERFAMVSGFAVALGMLGAVLGDISLTMLVQHEGWRTTILMSAAAGIVLMAILFMIIRDNPTQLYYNSKHSQDRAAYAIDFSHVFSGLWNTIKKPQIWLNGIISGFLYLPASAFAELWGIPFLEARGISSAASASAISMVFIGWAIGGPIGGWISDITRCRRWPILIGGFLGAVFISILLYAPQLSLTSIYVLLFCFGFASSVQIITFAVGREISSARISGTAIAFTNMLVMAFGALLQPFIGVFLDHSASGAMVAGVNVYALKDYHFALAIIPVGMALASVMTFFLRETHCKIIDA